MIKLDKRLRVIQLTYLQLHIAILEVKCTHSKLQAQARHLQAVSIHHNLVVLPEVLLLRRLPVDQPAQVANGLRRCRGAIDAHNVADLIARLSARYLWPMIRGY